MGYFNTILTYKDKTIQEHVYILPECTCLLSWHASMACGLITLNLLAAEMALPADVSSKYPQLFDHLRKLDITYDIQLDPSIHPYANTVPR